MSASIMPSIPSWIHAPWIQLKRVKVIDVGVGPTEFCGAMDHFKSNILSSSVAQLELMVKDGASLLVISGRLQRHVSF